MLLSTSLQCRRGLNLLQPASTLSGQSLSSSFPSAYNLLFTRSFQGGFNYDNSKEPKDYRIRPGLARDPYGKKVAGKRKHLGRMYYRPPNESPIWPEVRKTLKSLGISNKFLDLSLPYRLPKFPESVLEQDPEYRKRKERRLQSLGSLASNRQIRLNSQVVHLWPEEAEELKEKKLRGDTVDHKLEQEAEKKRLTSLLHKQIKESGGINEKVMQIVAQLDDLESDDEENEATAQENEVEKIESAEADADSDSDSVTTEETETNEKIEAAEETNETKKE